MLLKLEARPQTSTWMRYLSPLIAFVLMLVGGFVLFSMLGESPLYGLRVFFLDPVRDLYGVSELLLKATPLMLIGMGLAVAFRAGIWNIGAEGQYIVGAIFATGVALYAPTSGLWVLPVIVLAAALGGGLWAAIPAWLRSRFRTNEILTSLMLVYVAQLLESWLVFGPWKDPTGFNYPVTKLFADNAVLPTIIDGMRLNIGFVFGLVVLAAGYVYLQRSFQGFTLQVAGESENAARFAGFSARRTIWIGMVAGGALAGVAGMTVVCGPVGQLTSHLSQGYGFTGIIIAFVGRLHPVGIFFASLLLAWTYLGGEQAQLFLGVPSSIAMVFQGMLLCFLLGSDLLISYRVRISLPRWTRIRLKSTQRASI